MEEHRGDGSSKIVPDVMHGGDAAGVGRRSRAKGARDKASLMASWSRGGWASQALVVAVGVTSTCERHIHLWSPGKCYQRGWASQAPVVTGDIQMQELVEAVKAFKIGKAAGPDGKPLEYWKAVLRHKDHERSVQHESRLRRRRQSSRAR